MATHSSILAWRIQWMEEPGRLQSMGSQRVRHNWAANTLHQKDKGSWKSTHSIAQFMRIRVWSQAYNDKRSNYIKGSHSPSFLVIVQLRWKAGQACSIIGSRPTWPLLTLKLNLVSVLISQSCPTLCDPMDYSPPGSSIHGILQARIL